MSYIRAPLRGCSVKKSCNICPTSSSLRACLNTTSWSCTMFRPLTSSGSVWRSGTDRWPTPPPTTTKSASSGDSKLCEFYRNGYLLNGQLVASSTSWYLFSCIRSGIVPADGHITPKLQEKNCIRPKGFLSIESRKHTKNQLCSTILAEQVL